MSTLVPNIVTVGAAGVAGTVGGITAPLPAADKLEGPSMLVACTLA